MLYYDIENDERKAVKAGVQLALSRYRDGYSRFVKGSAARLSYIDDEISRLARECAGAVEADASEVERQLRVILADEVQNSTDGSGSTPAPVSVSEPEKVDVTDRVGDDTEGKDYDGRPELEGVAEMDIKATEPVLVEEIDKGKIETVKLSCERCSIRKAAAGSVFCAKCNDFVLGATEEDPLEEKEAAQPTMCPTCGQTMQASTQNANLLVCPNCGTSAAITPPAGVVQQHPGIQAPQVPAAPAYTAKTAAPGDDTDYADTAQVPSSPAQSDPTGEQPQLPPAVEETGNKLADLYSSHVEAMGNANAAKKWSTPDDKDIEDIASTYGLNPDDVRKHLKVVADFGDSMAVNGDTGGDPNTDGLTELDQFGGRIPTQEEPVDVSDAIRATADAQSLDPDDVYSVVTDAYGDDLGNQQFVSVTGEAHFYLPQDLVPQQQQAPEQLQPDTDSPTETPEEAVQSSTIPTRFNSVAEFLEWDRQRVSA